MCRVQAEEKGLVLHSLWTHRLIKVLGNEGCGISFALNNLDFWIYENILSIDVSRARMIVVLKELDRNKYRHKYSVVAQKFVNPELGDWRKINLWKSLGRLPSITKEIQAERENFVSKKKKRWMLPKKHSKFTSDSHMCTPKHIPSCTCIFLYTYPHTKEATYSKKRKGFEIE